MENKLNIATIEDHIRLHIIEYWATHCAPSLGYIEMPEGYALMRSDSGYFYWLSKDGRESIVYSHPINTRIGAFMDKGVDDAR